MLSNEHLKKYSYFLFYHQNFEAILEKSYAHQINMKAQEFEILLIKGTDFNVISQESDNQLFDKEKLKSKLKDKLTTKRKFD